MRAGRIFITDLDELGLLHRVRGTRPTVHYRDVIVEHLPLQCKRTGTEYVSIDDQYLC